MFALRHLPFPEQIGAIDAIVADGRGRHLVDELARFADHQPLAHAVAALARRGDIDAPFAGRLAELLLTIADPGLRRVLRALDDLDQVPRALAEALAAAAGQLPVARIAATSLVDRWLKSAAPDLRAARVAGVLGSCRELIGGGRVDEIGDELLAGVRGADHADLAAVADRAGLGDRWRARLGRFAAAVIGALEAQPRSLSQASAEELLARQVYTDPGHFLVELLQNADDAGARSFEVTIEDDRITVEHDGVPFDARDVVGVLSIGQTTKTVDQIGFFGVGFKSVYEICERPQIYSGPFAFEIADVSIPRPLAPRSASLAGRTLLVLPLRDPADPERNPDRLHERVSALPAEVLMTLDHIERIESTRGVRRRLLRREVEPGRVQLVEDGERRTYAVERGTARYTGHRDAHRAEVTPILVAVALDDQDRAAPVVGPTIYSHLPTKERSGLRFLVHARFDVPLDRERLDLSSPWNRWALTEAAPLFARLVARLAAGDPGAALAVVPLPDEVAHDAYRELAEVAATDLCRSAILPGADGERLAPCAALTVDDPRVARALAGVEVIDGRRPCAPLAARETAVARMLGARPLQSADIVAVIAREAGAAGSFAAPWSAARLAELAEVLGADPAADLSPLRDARFLPDHRGCARLPSEVLRADGELRALLAPVRPLVADELAGPGSHRFLDGVGARVARTGDLVGELVHGDRAAAVVAAAGSSRLIAHLAAAPPGELGDVQAARVVPGAGDTL
ncbi:MAG TPA: hypothetical protein VK698_32380, partial [Kofleriaceae bacterium]|nr:hypothetical protein [Kofleriaceae bacterium]